MFAEQAKRGRKGFKGVIRRGVAGNVLGVSRHASLSSSIAHIPSPTSLVPIFSLDEGDGVVRGRRTRGLSAPKLEGSPPLCGKPHHGKGDYLQEWT